LSNSPWEQPWKWASKGKVRDIESEYNNHNGKADGDKTKRNALINENGDAKYGNNKNKRMA
jgi:hypothetical protein